MARCYEWKIPDNKTVLFMGASLITLGIDDSNLENAVNISQQAEGYLFTYLKLQKILSNTNNKITHVILQCAPTDLSQIADRKLFRPDNEMLKYIPQCYPYFSKEEWKLYDDYKLDIIKILLSRFFVNWALSSEKYFSKYGGFIYYKDEFDETKMTYARIDSIYYGNNVNLLYLNKIVDLCNIKNIRLTLLYCPVYKLELFYDQEYFYSVRNTMFGNCEFLDYSHLSIPNEYRFDAFHLNGKGAKYFTKILAEKLNLKYKNNGNKTN
jgi:hypothetical protein